ncbi:putative plasma membrane phosphate transporter pho87 protein [Zymoseptoria brevis]|uniref:Putative plasma membrane phosphate transporter pho87 protein n=1 Tax=Zymoseptoria brevis TaxID=1047168 RepID=A0A0F4GY39_9PEZI|nr:putative plasma membrane phosphate transporter pho87 protein [Zymoseptoria brevis]
MKFSHSIQFNAVPDWSSNYISYSNLKKLIYQLEKQVNQLGQPASSAVDPESSPLLASSNIDDPDQVFARKLDDELQKICSFYKLKESEIYGEVDALLADIAEFEADHDHAGEVGQRRQSLWDKARRQSIFRTTNYLGKRRKSSNQGSVGGSMIREEDESEDDDNENTALNKSQATIDRKSSRNDMSSGEHAPSEDFSMAEVRRRPSAAFADFGDDALQALYDEGITLKKRTTNLYVSICELRSFIQLNETGFSKVLKKYDKIVDRNLKSEYVKAKVKPAYPFQSTTLEKLQDYLQKIEEAYAGIVTKGDVEAARGELRLHLREHVVWERNTVWREMIGIERKAQAANLGIRNTMLGTDSSGKKSRLQGDQEEGAALKEVNLPIGKYRCPKFLLAGTFWVLMAIIAIFIVLLVVPIMDKPEQQNCLALVVFVSLLWATEAIPLFVTSLLVPFLCVILQVVREDAKPNRRLTSKQAAGYVFASMWTPVIMLLLGGFTIAAALSKYNIAKMMATFVLSKAGTKPRTVLLTSMGVAMFASMWISNVAAPVLCFSIIQPILRNLPSDSDMTKALLLGIALASNIGGAASPIASPQNLIALENMEPQPGWGTWFFVALPVCIISILLIWVLLLVTFRPGRNTTIVPIRPMKDKFSGVQYFISIVTIATIALWCVSHQLEHIFGDMGVVAIIPIVLFFGTGILTKEDFNNFLWTIIILAAGGLALGKAVNSSGLLTTIAVAITGAVSDLSLYGVTCVFAALIAVVATFISHTVAALIVLPLVREVGVGMSEPHPNLLVMSSVLMASAAMGLPTSGFPNMTAIMMEDSSGQRYLKVRHFLTRGIPATMMAYVVIISVGYGLMLAVGF